MLKPLDVANYFLSLKKYSDLTNLKLQKILYYAHGHHLALYNEPLFNAKIEAWEFGPVFSELYGKLKKYKSRAIRAPEKFDMKILGDKAEFLNQILDMYGSYSASKLCDLSHEKSSPWDVVFNNNDDNNLLNDHLMKVYFTEIVELSSKN